MKFQFKCKKCGNCCKGESSISLSEEDIDRISSFLKISKTDFLKKYAVQKSNTIIQLKTQNGFCIFFDRKTKLCKIHPAKPKKCKEWPFISIIYKDFESFKIIQNSCEGLKNINWEDIRSI